MAYVSLSNIIDSTANRATVNYVDAAINSSLGEIANAIGINNYNVNAILNKTSSLKDFSDKIYIDINIYGNSHNSRVFNVIIGNNVSNITCFSPGILTAMNYTNTKYLCKLTNNITNIYGLFRDGGGIYTGLPDSISNIELSYRQCDGVIIENNLNNLQDLSPSLTTLPFVTNENGISVYVWENSRVNTVFTNLIYNMANNNNSSIALNTTGKYYFWNNIRIVYANRYWPNCSGFQRYTGYMPILSKSITNLSNYRQTLTLFEQPNVITNMYSAYYDINIPQGTYFPDIMSGVIDCSEAFWNTKGDIVAPYFPNLINACFMYYKTNIIIPPLKPMPYLTNMSHMFYNSHSYIVFDSVNNYDNVVDITYCFAGTSININETFPYFNNVVSVTGMFNGANVTGNLEILKEKMPKVKGGMDSFAYGASASIINPICFNNCNSMASSYRGTCLSRYICGDNIESMPYTYTFCKISPSGNPCPVIGNNVTNCYFTYGEALTSGNIFIYANNIANAAYLFQNRYNNTRLNIYVFNGTNTYNTFQSIYNIMQNYKYYWYGSTECGAVSSYNNKITNIYFYPVNTLTEMKQLDTNNWYSNGVHK